MKREFDRRDFLKATLGTAGILSLGPSLTAMASSRPFLDYGTLKNLGPLGEPNEFGLRLPAGFTARIIAQANHRVVRQDGSKTSYPWHIFPDGGATFATPDGGWIYTSNSEVPVIGSGGAGAIRFDQNGGIVDAYRILSGTSTNCAGGPTPWGTWLSCEEIDYGSVYECDVTGQTIGKRRAGLGNFKHEAVTIDPVKGQAYLTEDCPDGRFYRYTPRATDKEGRMDLDQGLLEVAIVDGSGKVEWAPLPQANPLRDETPTRLQVERSTPFDGGEGIWYHGGLVYFTTKGDNRVWSYDTATQQLSRLYDGQASPKQNLNGVDNVTVSREGHVLVAEDGGSMQIVVLGPHGDVHPLLQLVGQDHSEITGPAINPQGTHLYFSSQRGPEKGILNGYGLTYEVLGRFG